MPRELNGKFDEKIALFGSIIVVWHALTLDCHHVTMFDDFRVRNCYVMTVQMAYDAVEANQGLEQRNCHGHVQVIALSSETCMRRGRNFEINVAS